MSYTSGILLADRCGNMEAQVVAAYLPRLLRRVAPGVRLLTNATTTRLDSEDETVIRPIGSVVLLPAYRSQTLPADLPNILPVLPLLLGSQSAGEDTLRAIVPILPPLAVTEREAWIEHGGHFHLEEEVQETLMRRLESLIACATQQRTTLAPSACCPCNSQGSLPA